MAFRKLQKISFISVLFSEILENVESERREISILSNRSEFNVLLRVIKANFKRIKKKHKINLISQIFVKSPECLKVLNAKKPPEKAVNTIPIV